MTFAAIDSTPIVSFLIWLVVIAALCAIVYVGYLYVGLMKTIYLTFELGLTVVWFWATLWQLSLMNEPTSDGGTLIGAFVFLAFGIGTAWMLCNEVITTARTQFHLELNLFRRYQVREKLAARFATHGSAEAPEVPFDLPEE